VGQSTAVSEDAVTVAAIDTKSRPITIWMTASRNWRVSSTRNPGTLARATPITSAVTRPVSARTASESAAIPTTVARIASAAR